MSFEHIATGNSAADCLNLRDLITQRYAPHILAENRVGSVARIVQKFIVAGLITIAPPVADLAAYQRRKHQLTREQQQALNRKQALQSIRDAEKLDRAVSFVKGLGREPIYGELPRIAREWGVDYRRLLNRVKGKTKTSRL